jgi:hypothetical protein
MISFVFTTRLASKITQKDSLTKGWAEELQIKILILFHQEQNRSILFYKHALLFQLAVCGGEKR